MTNLTNKELSLVFFYQTNSVLSLVNGYHGYVWISRLEKRTIPNYQQSLFSDLEFQSQLFNGLPTRLAPYSYFGHPVTSLFVIIVNITPMYM